MDQTQMDSIAALIDAAQANVVTAGIAVLGLWIAVRGFKWIKSAAS